jgi:hypothetical protein
MIVTKSLLVNDDKKIGLLIELQYFGFGSSSTIKPFRDNVLFNFMTIKSSHFSKHSEFSSSSVFLQIFSIFLPLSNDSNLNKIREPGGVSISKSIYWFLKSEFSKSRWDNFAYLFLMFLYDSILKKFKIKV